MYYIYWGNSPPVVHTISTASTTSPELAFKIEDAPIFMCDFPSPTAFAIQPSCTNSISNSDGYLQLSAVTDGDKLNFSTGNTYTGDADYANAITIGALPFQFNTGLSNPTGSQDYTIRVFNAASDCFMDVVVTMNEQDCTVGCSCNEYLYLNDTESGEVHKFLVSTTDSTITEIGNPWMSGFDDPHGLGVDINGNFYIGDKSQGPIYKVDCDGGTVATDATVWTTAIQWDLYNIGSYNGYIITNGGGPGLGNKINVFDPCDGSLVGSFCLEGLTSDWGLQVLSDGTILATNGGFSSANKSIYQFQFDTTLFNGACIEPFVESTDILTLSSPLTIDGTTYNSTVTLDDFGSLYGITSDGDYLYVLANATSFSTAYILKINAITGVLVAVVDETVNTNSTVGWGGALGLVYAPSSDLLYVSGYEDCISILDPSNLSYIAAGAGPVGPNSNPKAVALVKECCPTNNNITIDTALCGAAVNDKLFLQELVNCDGTICEGIWTEGGSNTGLTYNVCDNSVTINAGNACGTFSLESDGTGNNPQCGAFTITVNISVNSLNLTVNKTSCVDNSNGTFTANYDVVVDWNSQPCEAGDMINVTHNGTSIGIIAPSTDSSPSTFSAALDADGTGTHIFNAAFTLAGCSDSVSFKAPLPCPNDVTPCAATSGCIGGNVFEDNNCNGINNTESGLQGIEVQIYDCDNVLVGTGFTDSEGDWQVCSLTDGIDYRIEFILSESIACDYSPTRVGTDNNSNIQFSTTNNCLKFGLSPIAACASSVMLITPCYNFGGYQGTYKDNDAFVGVQTNKIDDPLVDAAGTVIHYATHEQIGATYGVAIKRETNTAYTAAYMKRHTGFGPDGTGAIYKIDLSQANPPSLLADLNSIYGVGTAGVNPHDYSEAATCTSTNFSCWFNDVDAWNKVGRTSLGDMDISTDESTLYVMNLEDRKVYQVDLANPTAVQPTFSFPLDQVTDPNVTLKPRDAAYDIRPFGLSYHNDLIYVAAIDSEQSRDRDNICCSESPAVVYVYSLNPTTGNWTLVLEESVQRGTEKFFHWNDDFKDDYRDGGKTIPSDIEFDGDDIILGFRDIAADQFGNQAGKPIAGDGTTVTFRSNSGDIMRFCYDNSSNTYNFEANGTCGGVTSAGVNTGDGWPAATTPRGSYYTGDYYNSFHTQTALGGLWLNPADNRIYSTVYDINDVYNVGIKALDNTTGLTREGYILIADSQPSGGFGKAAGLGDLEAACPIFSLEIGNYVWCDSLENGIQDACERGINDIIVQLYDRNGILVGQDTTLNGQYYFNEYNVDTTGVTVNGSGIASPVTAWSGISYNTQYFIVFGGGQFATNEFTVGSDTYGITTFLNAGSNDNIDSDVDGGSLTAGSLGARPDGLPFIDMTTGTTGCGDHKYDLGVTCISCAPPSVTAFAIQPSCTNNAPNSDGYLQFSAVTDGDAYHWSTGNTFDDMSGANTYANATDLTGATYPLQFATGQTNPSGSRDYTIRVYGLGGCYTDVVVTMQEQDCMIGCECTDYIYLNEISNGGKVHKYAINPVDGSLTEILNANNAWYPGANASELPKPHGLAIDLNGNLYIGSTFNHTDAKIRKFNCDGAIVPEADFSIDIPEGTLNLNSIDNMIFANIFDGSPDGRVLTAFDACTQTEINTACLNNSSGGFLDWGFYYDKRTGYFYSTEESGLTPLWRYTIDDFGSGVCIDPWILPGDGVLVPGEVEMPRSTVFGITTDELGNIYMVANAFNAPGRLVKYDANGAFLAESDFDNMEDGVGYYAARGIVYSEDSGLLYVSSTSAIDDCLALFDTNLNYLGAAVPPNGDLGGSNPLFGQAKAVSINRECCPTNNNITIDTTLCATTVNEMIFLQELINCEGSICEGVWAADGSNTGLTYNSCDNSVTINALAACGSFTLESDGIGNNPQCGTFKITVNISVNVVTASIVAADQSICSGGDPAAFTVTTPATGGTLTYQWQSSANSLSGYSDIGSAMSATYDPPANLTDTTYYRVLVNSANASCSTGNCADTSNYISVFVLDCDWGDLPDGTSSTAINDYQTSKTNNGPVHVIIPGLSLGIAVDGETDGQPSADALGDGLDEDGLTILGSLNITPDGTFRLPLNYTNTTGLPAYIEAWIDWNANGEFDAGEMVLDVMDASAGTYDRLEVTVPTDAVTGEFLGLRIRISNQDNMTPYGLINGGEIEDYLIGLACKTQICLPINVTIKRQ